MQRGIGEWGNRGPGRWIAREQDVYLYDFRGKGEDGWRGRGVNKPVK